MTIDAARRRAIREEIVFIFCSFIIPWVLFVGPLDIDTIGLLLLPVNRIVSGCRAFRPEGGQDMYGLAVEDVRGGMGEG